MWKSQAGVKETRRDWNGLCGDSPLIVASGLPSSKGKSSAGRIHHFYKAGTRSGTDAPHSRTDAPLSLPAPAWGQARGSPSAAVLHNPTAPGGKEDHFFLQDNFFLRPSVNKRGPT